jgi:hypothetical protein
LADYAQNANNRGNITGTDVFGRNTTAFGTDVDAVGAFAVVPIPEPTSMVLLLLGTSLFVARRRL